MSGVASPKMNDDSFSNFNNPLLNEDLGPKNLNISSTKKNFVKKNTTTSGVQTDKSNSVLFSKVLRKKLINQEDVQMKNLKVNDMNNPSINMGVITKAEMLAINLNKLIEEKINKSKRKLI